MNRPAVITTGKDDRPDSIGIDRVKGLLFLRLAAVVVALAVILVAQAGRGAFDAALHPTYVILIAVSLVNLGCLLVVKRVRNFRRFAAVQIYLDVGFIGALVYVTGAGESNVTPLYFACILAASTLLGLGQGVMVASLATVCVAAMRTLTFLAGQYGWTLPFVMPDTAGPLGFYGGVASLMAQSVAYYLVAILAGRLAHGLSGVRMLNEKILESIEDGLLATDAGRRVRAINHEAMRLLGLSGARTPVGRLLDEVVAGSSNVEVLRELFKGDRPAVSSVTLVSIDGHETPVGVTSSALRDERGRAVGMVVMLIDQTERKRLEEALARAEKMEMVGQLAASIAHEIRNPLACIRGSAQEIRSDLPPGLPSGRLLDLVIRESDRINAIVSDFLHFSRMRRTALTRCNLTTLLSDVLAILRGRRDAGNVRIEFDPSTPIYCLGDVEQLKQVFLNLGLNAIDAMPDGGCLRVTVRQEAPEWSSEDVSRRGARVVVEFADEGVGMTDEVRRQLFSPFFSTKSRGTGLGLCIVRRIVEAHRGRVEVESVPGSGSTFRVVLDGYQSSELPVPSMARER
jgi:two-component system sensor histidine kinase PilS (NtrC family)